MPVRSSTSSVLRWPDRSEVLRAVRTWAGAEARTHPGLHRLGVFGSYARGDHGVGSDVDLVAVVASADAPFLERGRTWSVEVLPVPADLLVYTEHEWGGLQQNGGRFAATLARDVLWVYPAS